MRTLRNLDRHRCRRPGRALAGLAEVIVAPAIDGAAAQAAVAELCGGNRAPVGRVAHAGRAALRWPDPVAELRTVGGAPAVQLARTYAAGLPSATVDQSLAFPTRSGERRCTSVPSPTSLSPLRPQQYNAPLRMPQVWSRPAATVDQSLPEPICTGAFLLARLLSPSWPSSLLPQQNSEPPRRPHAYVLPAATCDQSASVPIWVGELRAMFVASPSCPCWLLPQQNNFPEASPQLWPPPSATCDQSVAALTGEGATMPPTPRASQHSSCPFKVPQPPACTLVQPEPANNVGIALTAMLKKLAFLKYAP